MEGFPFVLSETKIAPSSLMTEAEQVALYAQEKGMETAVKQVRAARLATRKCICAPQKLTKRWEGMDKPTTRTVHDPQCPRWKSWMVWASDPGR